MIYDWYKKHFREKILHLPVILAFRGSCNVYKPGDDLSGPINQLPLFTLESGDTIRHRGLSLTIMQSQINKPFKYSQTKGQMLKYIFSGGEMPKDNSLCMWILCWCQESQFALYSISQNPFPYSHGLSMEDSQQAAEQEKSRYYQTKRRQEHPYVQDFDVSPVPLSLKFLKKI